MTTPAKGIPARQIPTGRQGTEKPAEKPKRVRKTDKVAAPVLDQE